MLVQTLRMSNTTLVPINVLIRLLACYQSLHRLACDVQFEQNLGKCHPKSLIVCFMWRGNFVVELPGNSPNRHMAGEEFWRGNNNGFVQLAPKISVKSKRENLKQLAWTFVVIITRPWQNATKSYFYWKGRISSISKHAFIVLWCNLWYWYGPIMLDRT